LAIEELTHRIDVRVPLERFSLTEVARLHEVDPWRPAFDLPTARDAPPCTIRHNVKLFTKCQQPGKRLCLVTLRAVWKRIRASTA
jgi:hypothetical protein